MALRKLSDVADTLIKIGSVINCINGSIELGSKIHRQLYGEREHETVLANSSSSAIRVTLTHPDGQSSVDIGSGSYQVFYTTPGRVNVRVCKKLGDKLDEGSSAYFDVKSDTNYIIKDVSSTNGLTFVRAKGKDIWKEK